ncbi:MAG: glycosyltransferase family 4 protein [Planctomycetes bacterium]|nr:glycosyltransferase family 4 protein [Planctomycetota bacterium]
MPLPIALDYRPALLSATGLGRAARELARGLAARPDLEVHLFGHCLARARVPVAVPPGARLHRWPLPGRSLPWLARCGFTAQRLAGRARVCHWTDYVHPPAGPGPVVLTVHDLAFARAPEWHGPAAAGLAERTRVALQRATAVVAPSQATAADLRTFAPDAPKARVIPFGADHLPERTAAPHPLGGRPYLLCLGTLEPRKNLRSVLAALPKLPELPLLVVLGRIGWQCEPIVADLREAVRAGRASWHDDVADHDLPGWLQHAEALVYPSLWEGFGFPPLEAMRLGTPVLLHDCAPLRELAADAAQFADAREPAALASALDALCRDRELRRVLIGRGRQRAATYRWADCATAHAALYHEVAS